MEHSTLTSSAEELAAAEINRITVQQTEERGEIEPRVLATRIEMAAALHPDSVRALMQKHTVQLQNLDRGVKIKNLEEGVGGEFDGDVSMATTTVMIDQSGIETAGRRMNEVDLHEAYHADHHHLDPLKTAEVFDGGTVVTIGGQSFNQEEITEAVTVAETGQEFVSDGYRNKVTALETAVAMSSVTYAQVRDALNKRDLTEVDDSTVLAKDGQENPENADRSLQPALVA